MATDSKVARRMALKKKIEEEYRLAEERRKALSIRKHVRNQCQDKIDDNKVVGNHSFNEILGPGTNIFEGEELKNGVKLTEANIVEEIDKRQIVEDLERIIDKKEMISMKLEEYKKKIQAKMDKVGIIKLEKDELIIETEEKLLEIQTSIETLVNELNKISIQ